MSRKYRHHVGMIYFVAGILVGIFATNFVSFFLLSYRSSSSLLASKLVSDSFPFQTFSHDDNSITATNFADDQRISTNHLDHNRHHLPSINKRHNSNGWSSIHVFYGNTSHLPFVSTIHPEYYHHEDTEWFSQSRQDLVVATLLRNKTNGYFVDLAANDAVRISNTYGLERNLNWTGLCIEPNPIYWASLSYRGNNCHVIGAVIGHTTMNEVEFKFPNRAGPQGGIVGKEFDNQEHSKYNEDSPRYTVSLLDIFEKFNSPYVIDYLSLDVEGAEEYIMSNFPFTNYRFRVLTIERPSGTLQKILERNGYVQVKELKKKWREALWVHQSEIDNDSLDMSALNIDTDGYKYREIVSTRKRQ